MFGGGRVLGERIVSGLSSERNKAGEERGRGDERDGGTECGR